MSELICDFCSAPRPSVEYPADETELPGLTISIGSWLACADCAELIDADDREALALRSYSRLPMDDELRGYEALTLEAIRRTQAEFWTSRTGPGGRIRRTPLHGRRFVR